MVGNDSVELVSLLLLADKSPEDFLIDGTWSLLIAEDISSACLVCTAGAFCDGQHKHPHNIQKNRDGKKKNKFLIF